MTPAASRVREFYPLAVGNRWTYERTFTIVVEVLTGPPDKHVERFEGTVEREIIGAEIIDGVEYLVERSTLEINGQPNVRTTWLRFRQDRAGLYTADVSMNQPPASSGVIYISSGTPDDVLVSHAFDTYLSSGAKPRPPAFREALRDHIRRIHDVTVLLDLGRRGDGGRRCDRRGGVLPGELLTLDYPLRPGVTWLTRTEPFTVRSEVEAREVLDLPAGRFRGFRVRVDNERLDPEDRLVAWYGRCGNLASLVHAETLAMDVETGEISLITTDDETRLSDLFLGKSGGCPDRHGD
jgi:hypothetical protein